MYVKVNDYGLRKLYKRHGEGPSKTMTKWGVYFEMDTNEFMWDNGTQQIGMMCHITIRYKGRSRRTCKEMEYRSN